jgi:hypothetical protein
VTAKGLLLSSSGREARNAAKNPTVCRIAYCPPAKNNVTQNIKSAEVEIPWIGEFIS